MTSPITYDDIKSLATELGRPASTLIVLAPANDPFYCGPARQAQARWFANEIWPLLDPEADSVHIRRLHYLVVNQPPDRRPAKLDGTYIADFDPGGDVMPVSIARKIEHILRRDDHEEPDGVGMYIIKGKRELASGRSDQFPMTAIPCLELELAIAGEKMFGDGARPGDH